MQVAQGTGRLQRSERLLLQTEREREKHPRYRGNTACHERTNAKSEKTINIDMEISKTIKPEENAEVSEMLGYVMGQLKHNGGKWDLTDDAGKPVIFDAEKNVYMI
jgi:PP-loop superfamily ATP-utilizing enzyme